MRAAILSKPGEIQVTDLPEPIPGPGELKIAVRRVGICGSDLARFEGHLPQKRAVVFGHEFSGRVVAWGAGVTSFTPGQPVTVAPLLSCGHCAYCLQDKGYLCPERVRFGADVAGAMQEFVCVPAGRAYSLPDQLPLEYGAVSEPLAVALHAIHQVELTKDMDIAILGGGAMVS
jgi:threonine dehydrogenase-like Zn-dependent dehydrogenase